MPGKRSTKGWLSSYIFISDNLEGKVVFQTLAGLTFHVFGVALRHFLGKKNKAFASESPLLYSSKVAREELSWKQNLILPFSFLIPKSRKMAMTERKESQSAVQHKNQWKTQSCSHFCINKVPYILNCIADRRKSIFCLGWVLKTIIDIIQATVFHQPKKCMLHRQMLSN